MRLSESCEKTRKSLRSSLSDLKARERCCGRCVGRKMTLGADLRGIRPAEAPSPRPSPAGGGGGRAALTPVLSRGREREKSKRSRGRVAVLSRGREREKSKRSRGRVDQEMRRALRRAGSRYWTR